MADTEMAFHHCQCSRRHTHTTLRVWWKYKSQGPRLPFFCFSQKWLFLTVNTIVGTQTFPFEFGGDTRPKVPWTISIAPSSHTQRCRGLYPPIVCLYTSPHLHTNVYTQCPYTCLSYVSTHVYAHVYTHVHPHV